MKKPLGAWVRRWGDRLRSFEAQPAYVYPDIERRQAKKKLIAVSRTISFPPTHYASRPVDGDSFGSSTCGRMAAPRWNCAAIITGLHGYSMPGHPAHWFESASRSRQHPNPKPIFRDVRVMEIEGAGHWIHHDQPAAVLHHLREFLPKVND
jgi:pimeloyl-ACP methyl ester carboxylesterase